GAVRLVDVRHAHHGLGLGDHPTHPLALPVDRASVSPLPTRRSTGGAHRTPVRGRAQAPAGVGPSHGYDGQRTSVISGPRCSWPMPPAKREPSASSCWTPSGTIWASLGSFRTIG